MKALSIGLVPKIYALICSIVLIAAQSKSLNEKTNKQTMHLKFQDRYF